MRWLVPLLCIVAASASAAEVSFTTWLVPWEQTRPRDPEVHPDGGVWFVGQVGDYVARLDPASGDLRRRDLPEGTGPHNCIVGAGGDVWIAGNRAGWIGRLDPEAESLETIAMPAGVKDPHTLIQAPDGTIWFTAQWSNRIGRLDPETGATRTWEVPVDHARPYGIVLDSSHRPWVALLGTNALATIAGGTLETVTLPRSEARPRRLAVVDGSIWYVDYAEGHLGVYDPRTQNVREWRSPAGPDAQPYGMAADPQGRVWYAETGPQPNRWIGFDTGDERFIADRAVPDSGGAIRHMVYDSARNAVWFGMDTNYIGCAALDAAAGEERCKAVQ